MAMYMYTAWALDFLKRANVMHASKLDTAHEQVVHTCCAGMRLACVRSSCYALPAATSPCAWVARAHEPSCKKLLCAPIITALAIQSKLWRVVDRVQLRRHSYQLDAKVIFVHLQCLIVGQLLFSTGAVISCLDELVG